MNREIKFRAWNGEKMCPVTAIEFDAKGIKSVTVIADDLPGQYMHFEKIEAKPGGIIPVFESTGLHDRNGNEIYEGYIMKHPDFREEDELEVTIQNGYVAIGGWDCVKTDITKGIVIGNIYETKDATV